MIDAPTSTPEQTSAPTAPASPSPAAAPAAPAVTTDATPKVPENTSVLGIDQTPKAVEPAAPEAKVEAPAAEAPAEKADEKPDAGEDVEYVKASDYDKAQEQLQKYLAKYGELPADDAPAVEDKPAESPQAQPTPKLELNPDLIMQADDVSDEDLELLGWDSKDPIGQAQRENVAKFGSKIASRAAEYAVAQATATFQATLAENVAIQVAVHHAHQQVASALLGKHPELGTQENFPKAVKAIQQAVEVLGKNSTPENIAAKAKQLFDEGRQTVERFKSQGGKVIPAASAGPGTSPRDAAGPSQAPPQRREAAFGPGSLLGR